MEEPKYFRPHAAMGVKTPQRPTYLELTGFRNLSVLLSRWRITYYIFTANLLPTTPNDMPAVATNGSLALA